MIAKIRNLLICLLLLPIAAFGSTLSQYQQKIKDVTESVGYLSYPEESLTDAENIAQQREILKEIRTKLPPNEKIELKDANFEVNHDWLYEKLKQFENEPYRSTKRTPIINEILDRLSALEIKINELQNQEIANRTKDQDKQKLDEILKRAEYQKPAEREETWLQRKWREFWEWVRSLIRRPEVKDEERQIPEGSPALASGLLYLVLAIAVGLIIFLIYRFAPTFWERFKDREKKDDGSRVILGETLSAEDSSNSIFAEAENLARTGNLRAAIRKGYIALLCELSDKKIIGLARHKTNRDYLRDVRNKKELHQNMNSLTVNFERNWYGNNETDEREWEEFREVYRQTVETR
jgi:hypothetical protein